MYQTLKKLKDRLPYESWLKMVNQAYEAGKLTKEEYDSLLKDDEE